MPNNNKKETELMDFELLEGLTPQDEMKGIIKVVGVGGGGCNAVANMVKEGIKDVTFAAVNTDSQVLAKSPVPQKLVMGGLGAGGNPDKGREEAEKARDNIRALFDDGTKLAFVTAGMGGGTGTGAAPIVAGIAKDMGILTVGIVTIPFFFEKQEKIIKALRGVNEMRKNVDAILIINNERLCDVYADTAISVKEAFRRADKILLDAAKSIAELITIEGDINLDFRDVETTLRGGGGAIMAMGRGSGEMRVEKAIIDALDSPLLYGNDISKAKRILFNVYTSEEHPFLIPEMNEVDAFMAELDPKISVIWGVCDDNTLGEDAKITILASDFELGGSELNKFDMNDDEFFEKLMPDLYRPYSHHGKWFHAGKLRQSQKDYNDGQTLQTDVEMKIKIGDEEVNIDDMSPVDATEVAADGCGETVTVGDVEPAIPETGYRNDVSVPYSNDDIDTYADEGTSEDSEPGNDNDETNAGSAVEAPVVTAHSAEKTQKDSPQQVSRRLSFIERAKLMLRQKMEELMTDNEDI